MSVLTTIPNGASNRDIRDTINALLNRVSVLEAAGTPAPTPAPAFASQPSINPGNGTAGTTTFAATPGTVTNGSVVSRAWLLNGTAISTGLTATPQQSGTLTYQETASGPGGTTTSAIQAAGVAAASVTPTPTPSFTAQPSISPSSGTAGATTFTATPGTVSNGSISSRAWAINGTVISTSLTASPASSGTLTYQETATGPGGTTQSTVLQVAVGSAAAAAPAFTAQPSVSPGNGTANSTTFTATPGTVSNGSITSRSWSLNGSVISTALTAAPTAAGTLTYQEAATGSGGTTQSTAQTVTVSAAAASTSLTIAWAGSSTYEKGGTDGSGPTVADATRSTDGVTFTPIGTQGAALLTYAAIMKNRTGLPVKYLLEGHGGSTVAGWLSQGSGDRKGLVDAIKAAGGCDLLNWACGFNDALQNIVVSEAQHLANLRALFALIRSETGLPNLKITVGVSQPYRGTASAGPDSVWTAVRSAEMTVAQDANNYFSSHWFDLPQGGDGIHLTGEGMTALYTRVAENGLAALGLGGAVAETGPRIIAAQALYSTKTRLTLAHSRGSDFTPTTALSGFLVSFDNGATFVTPTAAARVDATHIDLTHAASGGAAPTIWVFPGKSPVTTAVLHDNSPRALPLNPTYSAGIKAAAGSSAAEPGAPVDTTAPLITSAATASQPENAAFSLTLTANEAVTWSKVGGADAAKFTLSGATLTLPAQDYEVPTDADANRTYIVTVRATDTAGNTADQTITVTITDVAEGGTSTGKTAKLAFSKANIAPAGFNAFFGDVSQTQNANAGRTKALLDTAGAATGWMVTTTNFNGGNDTQGTTTGANTGAYPDAAMLGYWYNGVAANGDNGGVATPSTTLTVSGLNPAKKYTFKAFGARAATDRKTTYTAGGTSQTIDCGQNTSLVATFASLTPDSSGALTLTFAPAAANGYGYLNVLEIVEA